MVVDPIEYRARREALGLSQADLARLLGVGQSAVSQWETGSRTPRDPVGVLDVLAGLEDVLDELADVVTETGEHSSALRGSPEVVLRTYPDDDAYWAADAGAARRRIPAAVHRAATALAARALAEDAGIAARIVTA